ncbi:MAG TPA: hypothetical protein V6C58_20735, partial [Allocoleopsis sp.]
SQITLIIDMVEKCSNGNFTERLEVSPDLMGAISEFLNLLIDSLTEEIKKSLFDSFLRQKYQINEGVLTNNNDDDYFNINNNDCELADFLTEFPEFSSSDIESDINSANRDTFLNFDDCNGVDNLSEYLNNFEKDIDFQIAMLQVKYHNYRTLFFAYITRFFDKKYRQYCQKYQKYDHILENLSRQVIAILDVTENWPRRDLRARITSDHIYMSEFEPIAHSLNSFIDNFTQDIKQLPPDSSLRKRFNV